MRLFGDRARERRRALADQFANAQLRGIVAGHRRVNDLDRELDGALARLDGGHDQVGRGRLVQRLPLEAGPQQAQLPAGPGEPRLLGFTIDLRRNGLHQGLQRLDVHLDGRAVFGPSGWLSESVSSNWARSMVQCC